MDKQQVEMMYPVLIGRLNKLGYVINVNHDPDYHLIVKIHKEHGEVNKGLLFEMSSKCWRMYGIDYFRKIFPEFLEECIYTIKSRN